MAFTAFEDPVQSQITSLVQSLDYIVVIPNNNAYKPGSFVARTGYDPAEQVVSSTKLAFLCTPKYSSGKIDAEEIRRSVGGFFSLPGYWIELQKEFVGKYLRMPNTAEYAESIVVRIVDRTTIEYSAEKLVEIRANLGPTCKSSIQAGISNNNAYQIAGVYEMRLQYEVRYPANLVDTYKTRIQNEMRRLGMLSTDADVQTIKGDVSVYGIKWDKLSKL